MITDEAIEELKLRFTSGNSVPVERAFLKKTEFNALIERLEAAERDAKRWQIASTSRHFGITNWCEFGQRTSYDGQAEKIIDTAIAAEQGNDHDH